MIQSFQRLLLGLALSLLAPGAWALTVVLNTNDSGAGSLRYTISNAPAGATITFTNTLSGATILLTNGELLLNKNLTVDGSALTNGIAINGNHASRIFEVSNAMVLLNALTITNAFGGGIFNNSGATLTVSNCNLTGNTRQSSNGGGIYNNGTLIMYQNTISGNIVPNLGLGGGIYNNGNLTMYQNTISKNSADIGGGIFNQAGGTMTLNQNSLSGNTVANYGGGICNYGNAILNQDTIVGNTTRGSSSGGGGLYNVSYAFLTNCIIAANTELSGSNGDIYNFGTMVLGGINLFQASLGASVTNSYIIAYPMLAPLGNYGGPTQTMPPLTGSLAIEGCTNTLFTVDQRGYPRTNGLSDIGAVQGVFNPAIPISSPSASFVNGTMTSFQFAFTNLSGPSYTVFATTNLALPFSQWANLGLALESPIGSGQFQFTDPQTATNVQRFYSVVSP
jgi:hypothetical protein